MNSRGFPSRPQWREPSAQSPCPYGDHDDDRSFRSEADSTRLNYSMDSSGHYARPLSPNGFVHAPASSVSERTPSDTDSFLPLRATTTTDGDCKKLEDSDRMMSKVFCVLVIACVLVVIVYIALIVYLFASLPEVKSQSASQSSASTSCGQGRQDGGVSPDRARDGTFCVDEKQMDELLNDYGGTFDFINKLPGYYRYSTDDSQHCFRNLSWIPYMMSKINNKVMENVNYIDAKQETINRTVSAYSSANSTRRKCDTDTSHGDSADSFEPSRSVFAHFFYHRNWYLGKEKTGRPLRLVREGVNGSIRRGIDVNFVTGTFSIRFSGDYYVYSHVEFKGDERSQVDCRIVKRTVEKKGETTLLRSQVGPVVVLQGLFTLQKGDTLWVDITAGTLDTNRNKSNYVGLYLIRN